MRMGCRFWIIGSRIRYVQHGAMWMAGSQRLRNLDGLASGRSVA